MSWSGGMCSAWELLPSLLWPAPSALLEDSSLPLHEATDGQDKAALPGSSCTPGVTRYILHSLNSKNVQVVLSMLLRMLKQNQAAVRQFYCRQS